MLFFKIFWACAVSYRWLWAVVAVVWRWWWLSVIVRVVGMRVVFVHMLYYCGVAAADGQQSGSGQRNQYPPESSHF
jgi:hypothetical protein